SIQLPSQDRNRIRTLNAFGYPTINECQSKFAVTDSLFASGACFLIRREWLHRIGYLFDPNYFCFGEDLELSLRTILLGGRIGYVCDSRIYHHAGGSGFPNAKVSYFSTRNFLLTYYKLFELKNFARIFWVHIAYIMMARHKQMLKGLLGFFSSFYGYGNYRKAFAKNKKRSDKYILGRFLFVERMEKMILKRAIYGC
ncbi:MAG TPA: glycosyltransferase, partial [Candidatus Bathyarchaeia archaeon]